MNAPECAREQETLHLVLSRRWPAAADAELQEHVEACAVCRDVVTVAAMLRSERDDSFRDVHVPAAGQIWWRSALRAHVEAEQAARRPVLWLQGIAAACAVALIASLVSLVWPSISDAAAALASLRPDVVPFLEIVQSIMPVAAAVLAFLVLTPIAVYFALSDD